MGRGRDPEYQVEYITFPIFNKTRNKIRDLFKVKLYIIRSKLKREREREQDFKYLLTLILTGGHK